MARYPRCRAAVRRMARRGCASWTPAAAFPAAAELSRIGRALADRQRQDGHARRDPREREQGDAPAGAVDQDLSQRSQQQGPERASGGDGADRPAASLRRHRPRHRAHHDAEPGAGDTETDEGAAEVETHRAPGPAHEHEPARIHQRRQGHHGSGAPAIREHADERLADTPHEGLERHGHAERRGRDTQLQRHRRQEQAQALPEAGAQRQDRGGEPQQLRGRRHSTRGRHGGQGAHTVTPCFLAVPGSG
jgi:hypothetical protein